MWRAQSIGDDREEPLREAGVVGGMRGGEQRLEQGEKVGNRHIRPHRTHVLGPVEQHRQRIVQFLSKFAGHGDRVGEVTFGHAFGPQPSEKSEKGIARIRIGSLSPRFADEIRHPGCNDGVEQRFLSRKVTVDGAGAHAGSGGDLVQRRAVPALGKDVTGRSQDPLPVASRIGPQRSVSMRQGQAGRSFRIVESGATVPILRLEAAMTRSPHEVVEQVRRMVAGEGVIFADLFAENGVLAYPFALPGQPQELRGREAIRAHFGGASRSRELFEMDGVDAVVRGTDDPEVVVAEIEHYGLSRLTGDRYRFRAIGVIRIREGEIISYQDYMDPIATARLLGRTADLAAALANS